jgi:hypothetical protein
MVLLVLLLTAPGLAFDFGSVVDEVGKAVKSGAAVVEEGVRKVIPGDETKKAGEGEGAKPAAPAEERVTRKVAEPARKAAAKTSIFEEEPEPPASLSKAPGQPGKVAGAASPKGSVPAEGETAGGAAMAPAAAVVPVAATAVAVGKASQGGTIFAKEPINPASPPSGVTSFVAGDRIYGMLKAARPWKEVLKSSNYLILYVIIDGKEKIYRMVTLKRPDLLALDYFIIDIAPDPAGMTNYADRDIVFPEKDGLRFGPEMFTKFLSELTPGTHTFRLEVKAYGDVYAAGEFTISGQSFADYATLLADIKKGGDKQQKMPRPGMTSLALEKEMMALLRDAGWPAVRRLVIIDKDWWINRVSGGNSPVESRHIAAAAAAKDSDGTYYFRIVTFHQPMVLGGGWGKLYISKTGDKKALPEENIDL